MSGEFYRRFICSLVRSLPRCGCSNRNHQREPPHPRTAARLPAFLRCSSVNAYERRHFAFRNEPPIFLPGAYVQYLNRPGTELTDVPIDQAEISGDMQSVLDELLLRVKVLNTHSLQQKTPLREQLVARYPDVAVREILLNAVVHRSYESNTPIRFSVFSDRIEIVSPGGLYGEVNIENFGTQSSYRNPVIAEALKVLGFVNRFGYGIRRAQRALAENGNKPLGIAISNAAVLITIWALDGPQ